MRYNANTVKSKVLMLTWEFPPHLIGGLGNHVSELVPALTAAGITVYIVTPRLNGGAAYEIVNDRLHVLRVDLPASSDSLVTTVADAAPALVAAAEHVRGLAGRIDLVHAHDWLVAPAALELKQRWRSPLLATIHATERGRWQGVLTEPHSLQIDELERQLASEAWRVIVCSQFMARQICIDFQLAPDKIDVVPNGVTQKQSPFSGRAEQQAFRRQFVADSERLAFHVGRIVYEKGLHLLLAAWPRILERHAVRLVIAGTGAYLEPLRAQAARLGIDRWVHFTGYISDERRDRLYSAADLAIFPALYEPFGIVALEAFAAGCPVVASAAGGMAETIQNHETGITVLPDNLGSLVWGILHTLDYPEWALARAANAQALIQAEYSWERVAALTRQVYARIHREGQANAWVRGSYSPVHEAAG